MLQNWPTRGSGTHRECNSQGHLNPGWFIAESHGAGLLSSGMVSISTALSLDKRVGGSNPFKSLTADRKSGYVFERLWSS